MPNYRPPIQRPPTNPEGSARGGTQGQVIRLHAGVVRWLLRATFLRGKSAEETSRRIAISLMVLISLTLVVLMGVYIKILSRPEQSLAAATVATQISPAHTVTVMLNIVPHVETGPHPGWVGYQTGNVSAHQQATVIRVPAHTRVTMIIRTYDTPTPLRNPFFDLVQGTIGGREQIDGRWITTLDPQLIAHTFAIVGLGVVAPLAGVTARIAPRGYVTTTFSFDSGSRGIYNWQCFNPCGHGNSGPMGTTGYMSGEIVVA